jgi:cytoskeleton protein RodZ
MDDVIQTENVSVLSPGAALAAARIAQGLTVEAAAGRLKLTSFQIEAMEADNFAALPGPVFARGFVRNYARLLNLDAAPLMDAMVQHLPQPDASQDGRLLRDATGVAFEKSRRSRSWPAIALVVAAAVGALAYYEFVLDGSRSGQPVAGVSSLPVQSAPVPVDGRTAPTVADAAAPLVGAQQSGGSNSNDTNTTAAAPLSSRGLHFLFSQESWVEVRDGLGNILFSQVNAAGTEQRIQGEPPFSLVVGGARGVQLAYNGNPVDLAAHATEGVARLRLD